MALNMAGKLKLTHLITSLDMGGAEMMLYRLLKHIDPTRFENRVISLIPAGVVGDKIRALGIPVCSLDMRSGHPSISAVFRLVGLLRREKPGLLHTWMYHADLIGGLAGFLTHTPVIWAIHNSSPDSVAVKNNTLRVVRLNAHLSGWLPLQIVSCSDAARKAHINIGYNPDKFIVIPNGFDLDLFHPDPAARISLRRELELSPDTLLIGLVARFDPIKDHQTFIQAARQFSLLYPQTHFLLCGEGISWQNVILAGWIESAGIRANCHLLGRRDDIPRVMAGLDINTLSSIGEAFPNVLSEAMACGVPCVTTDVGDAAEIVGDTGIVVPPGEPQALARGWEHIVNLTTEERIRLGEKARERIHSRYQIQQIVEQYESLYMKIVR
jgi:glycosyltransferase involved in cell wall biosynthesis